MTNKSYFDIANNLSFREKLQWKMANLFSKSDRKTRVLQIGVGGFSSSGKTVLIDAMFSLFDNNLKPGYMPKKFSGLYQITDKFQRSYTTYSQLRLNVSSKFHTDNKTTDKGVWSENTYVGKLKFCDEKIILLIRNLPGEIFNTYFVAGPGGTTVKTLLENFLKSHDEYKKIYKKIFSFNLPGKKNCTKNNVERLLNEIRDRFVDECLGYMTAPDRETFKRIHFYALMYYISSDYHVYCIKSGDTDEFDNSGIFPDAEDDALKKYLFCYTQFDTLINGDTLPQPEDNASMPEANLLRQIISFIWKRNESNFATAENSNDKLLKYWLSMNQLYKDLEDEASTNINWPVWAELRANTMGAESDYRWFIATVAYNYNRKQFYQFEGKPVLHPTRQLWAKSNNNQRTPIGVLELMLYILFSWGKDMKLKNLKMKESLLHLPETKETSNVLKKISVN